MEHMFEWQWKAHSVKLRIPDHCLLYVPGALSLVGSIGASEGWRPACVCQHHHPRRRHYAIPVWLRFAAALSVLH